MQHESLVTYELIKYYSSSGYGNALEVLVEQLNHLREMAGRERIFGAGAGLGLAIARWIAEAHGAKIELARPAAGGTRVAVTFPLAT